MIETHLINTNRAVLFIVELDHRKSIQQEGKRGGGGSSSLELNLTAVLEGCWAGGMGQLFQYMRKYKTGQQKVQLYCEDGIH